MPAEVPPFGSDTATSSPRRRPGRWWYALATGLIIVGVVSFLIGLSITRGHVAAAVEALHRFEAPGGTTVTAPSPGPVSIFYEQQRAADGEGWVGSVMAPDLAVAVQSPAGTAVESEQLVRQSVYRVGARRGYAIFSFQADQPGGYRVVVRRLDGVETPVHMAAGRLEIREHMASGSPVFFGAFMLAFGLMLGLAITLVCWFHRRGAQSVD